MSPDSTHRGFIAWMARNHVAVNLLVALLVLGGIIGAFSIRQEVYPEYELDTVAISVPYPGASPEETEQGIVLAIEEAVRGVDGVKRVTSTAAEGSGVCAVRDAGSVRPSRPATLSTVSVPRLRWGVSLPPTTLIRLATESWVRIRWLRGMLPLLTPGR